MANLPADLLAERLWSLRRGQSRCLGRVSGGTQGVCSHVRDACGLPGRSGSRSGGTAHLPRSAATDETAADLLCGAQLASGKGACPGDGVTGAAIPRSCRLKEPKHPLRTVRCPRRDDAPVGLAQRLG